MTRHSFIQMSKLYAEADDTGAGQGKRNPQLAG